MQASFSPGSRRSLRANLSTLAQLAWRGVRGTDYAAAVIPIGDWPWPRGLVTERLCLEPVRVGHAEEMARVLADSELYSFTGGHPLGLVELQARYRALALGRSADGSQRWLNWIARLRRSGPAVGTMQATVVVDSDHFVARLAWTIGLEYQRCGYAREAALAVTAWLREQGATELIADIHPQHQASIGVARALGFEPTGQIVDGEVRWTG
jgi:RimJ/RimL family protein N-acetyltransferase